MRLTNRTIRIARAAVLSLATVAAMSIPTFAAKDNPMAGMLTSADVTALAIATPWQTDARDQAFGESHLVGRRVRGGPKATSSLSTVVETEVAATATSDCDSCSSVSTSVGVTYVHWAGGALIENVANALSSCSQCSSKAVTVQVVVMRPGIDIHASNRAFAINTNCSECTTGAAAYQLVVVSKDAKRFTSQELDDLQAFAQQQADLLGTASRARSAAPQEKQVLDALEAATRKALGDVAVTERHADVRLNQD